MNKQYKNIIKEILIKDGDLLQAKIYSYASADAIIKNLVKEWCLLPVDLDFDEDGNFKYQRVEVTKKTLMDYGLVYY